MVASMSIRRCFFDGISKEHRSKTNYFEKKFHFNVTSTYYESTLRNNIIKTDLEVMLWFTFD